MRAGEYIWDDTLTWEFLQLYRDNLDKFRDPLIRNKDLYSRICATLLEKYPSEPLNTQLLTKKFFNLSRTHKKILMKKCSIDGYEVSWKFFDIMNKLLSSSTSNEVVIDIAKQQDNSFKFEYAWKDDVTFRFLELYLERIDEFRNPKVRNKTLYRNMANSLKIYFPDLPLTEVIVQKKFYNMKRTYLDIVQKKSMNKKYPINWKFFNKVHAIMSLTEQIKVEYVTSPLDYEDNEDGDFEEQSSAKRFKRELVVPTDMEDINFEEYVEYDNVEYDNEENQTFEEKQDLKSTTTNNVPMVSKFSLEMDQHVDLDEEIDDDPDLGRNADEDEEVVDLQMDDEEDYEEIKENDEEDQQNCSQLENEVFTITDSNDRTELPSTSNAELTPFMKAKLDIEGRLLVFSYKNF